MWERQAEPILFLQRLHAGDPFNEYTPTIEQQEILDQQPEMDDQCWLVLEVWQELDSCRQIGMFGAGKIPISPCLYDWARFNGLDRELTQMVASAIRYLDAERMERIASEQANKDGG